ncbi:DUF1127 domain-containing protein [Lutimaribacter marinistellae]|uniref:DUF1127 domain-containing protein n=1 Tax=Lutimaribacter marinistellae TaxID=1820329 RepID=A0ABV7TDY9_9RHOB
MAQAPQMHAPLGAVATLRVVDAVLSIKTDLANWNASRKTRAILSDLSDRQLDDIGLTRDDISKL